MGLVDRVVPDPSDAMRDRALAAAMKYVAEQGVTSVHNMGTWADLATFARARRANALGTRIYAVVPLADWARLRDVVASKEYGGADGRGDQWLRVGGLKGFVDGSLGSHTAAFHAPFDDAPKDRGLLVNTPEDLYAWISGADKAGLHVMVHAIGDRANGAAARHLRSRRAARTARETVASASSTRSTRRPPTSRALPRWASSRACSRITPSTTAGGPRSTSAPGSRRPTRSGRSSTRARGLRSAATGSSRRRRRSRASTPPSRGARSTTATLAGGCRSRRSRSRRRCAPTPAVRRTRRSRKIARACWRPDGSPIS